jgi:hypothetical protein
MASSMQNAACEYLFRIPPAKDINNISMLQVPGKSHCSPVLCFMSRHRQGIPVFEKGEAYINCFR